MIKLFTVLLVLLVSCSTLETNDYVIADQSSATIIYIDNKTDDLVKWAVNDLIEDLELISGQKITLVTRDKFNPEDKGLYIGMYGDELTKSLPENFNSQLGNQWEKFIIKKHEENLFVVGSDIRGTVFAIFDLAQRIGISPWKWWADVTPQRKDVITLRLPDGGIEDGPAVLYRGIFLNDEDWGLQPWAAKTFEPEVGDIGPRTYEKVFQLLLRLKANTIWPAMHPCTKAFYQVPGNNEMAKKYHIVVGTSHCEPMLCNNVDEWDHAINGDFNYFTNKEGVSAYWNKRIEQVQEAENIVTLGMRGIHDGHMHGGNSLTEKMQMVEQIIDDQRQMLVDVKQKPIDSIATTIVLYKEVLDLYNNGLTLPDDATIMWCDDNYGYIRRLSNEQEQKRKGGSGIYYHLSYWGRPHDYLWLSTTQPGMIWYEMSKAYQNGAQKIWIANVGDIKPCEYNMELFLDLAWKGDRFDESHINKHLIDWCTREFGPKQGEEIALVKQEYYRLAFLRKPEFMGWSQTEPTTKTTLTGFSTDSQNNEVQRRIDAYSKLYARVEAIKERIPENRLDAYFQLVEYPVKGAALMNHKFLLAQQSSAATNAVEKEALANQSDRAYSEIVALTAKYNDEIAQGKWQRMMSMKPRNLPVFAAPKFSIEESSNSTELTEKKDTALPIFIQANAFSNAKASDGFTWKSIESFGYSNASMTLFPFDSYYFTQEIPYLEYVFNVERAGKYEIEIRCIPTHANNLDHKLGVEVNGEGKQLFDISTEGRSRAWKENILRNNVSVSYSTVFEKAGRQSLKVSVNQTGIVLDQIAINSVGQLPYYEIVK